MVTVKNKAEGKPNIMEGRLVFSRRRQADKATLKVESTRLAKELDLGCGRSEVEDDFKVCGLSH